MIDNSPQASTTLDPRVSELRAALRGIEKRLRLREAVGLMPVCAALGVAATLLLALASRFTANLPWYIVLASGAGLVIAALVTGSLYALLRPRSEMATARQADALLGLDERLATALQIASEARDISLTDRETLQKAQLADTLKHTSSVSAARDLPARVDARKLIPAGALLALVIGVLVFPSLAAHNPQAEAVQEQIALEQEKVAALIETLAKNPGTPQDPRLQALLEELGDLARDLDAGKLTREEALARLSEAEDELEKTLDPAAPGERAALEKLAEQLATAQSQAARDAADALQSGDEQETAEAFDKLAREMGSASQAERETLAQSLREARDEVSALDPEMASRLSEAAESLSADDPALAQRALEELGKSVEESVERKASQEQIRQALAQIQSGKENVAAAGRPTPETSAGAGSPQAGTSVPGTAVSGTGVSGTPVVRGSPAAAGSATGTPGVGQVGSAASPGAGGTGTPAAAQTPGSGQGEGEGEAGGESQNSAGEQQGETEGQVGGPGWGTARQEPVSVPPNTLNAQGTPVALTGRENPEGESSSTSTNTDVNSAGPARVPYSEVYGTYREQAGKALENDYIPQGYKDLVRDYFTEIEPK